MKLRKALQLALQVLVDEVQLIDIFIDVIMPIAEQLFEASDVRVGEVAAQTQLSFCLNADAIIVVLLPRPDFLALLAVITNVRIV